MNYCRWCKQLTLIDDTCPCRNYLVWREDESMDEARKITAFSHGLAAEEYVDRFEDDPEDGDEYELIVKNYLGNIKRVTVTAEISIDFCHQIEPYESEVSHVLD